MELSTRSLNQSLNLYSIFGYLMPGLFFTLLYIIDFDTVTILRDYDQKRVKNITDVVQCSELRIKVLMQYFSSGTFSDFKFIPFLIYLFICYFLGHLISAGSSFFIERQFVKKVFGYPSALLLGEPIAWNWVRNCNFLKKLTIGFHRPFPAATIKMIDKTVKEVFKYKPEKSEYYWHCYSFVITKRPYLATRVHHFINLYGFSRNVSFAILLYVFFRAVVLNLGFGIGMEKFSAIVSILFSLAGLMMVWNYTKLFRRHAVDVFILFLSIQNDGLSLSEKLD